MLPAFSFPQASVLFCDADRASLGVFRRKGTSLECLQFNSVALPRSSGEDAASPTAEWVAALSSLRLGAAAEAPLILLLPPHVTLVKHLRLPRVDARKRAKLVEFEAAQKLPCSLSEVTWDTTLAGEDGATQQLMLAAVRNAALMPWCEAVAAAGFRLEQVVPFPLALLARSRLAHAFKPEPELVLHGESRAATLLLVNTEGFALRSWLMATDHDRAANTTQLVQEVARSVLHLRAQSGLGNPTGMQLAGEWIHHAADPSLFAAKLNLPVQALPPLTGLAPTHDANAAWPELAGAAAGRLLKGHPTMNLLPAHLRTRQRRRGRKPWLTAAALVLLGAPVVPFLQFREATRAAEARSAEIEQIVAPMRQHETAMRRGLAECAELRRRIVHWQELRQRRTSWLRMFADWQQRLGALEGVWIDRLEVRAGATGELPQLEISGRMLPMPQVESLAGNGWAERAKALLQSIERSPFLSRVASERFDATQTDSLAFQLVLVPNPEEPL
ncbi:hypothetical protein ESB00_08140 [Oleiharenicola lentus]|uniref:Fimbrial assembly protein n=1 Tax=Oleiharenicola lentus TaxID=2508720 RepID=A0A4Q1CAB5_9BACT|nr:hypothetical protein [Oleiharenicola lentus]RXK55840.1 hypothetical protein ESB00_08140 [Oleiharenicola lentus]